MTFGGLDFHKQVIAASALDARDAVLADARQLPVSLEALGLATVWKVKEECAAHPRSVQSFRGRT